MCGVVQELGHGCDFNNTQHKRCTGTHTVLGRAPLAPFPPCSSVARPVRWPAAAAASSTPRGPCPLPPAESSKAVEAQVATSWAGRGPEPQYRHVDRAGSSTLAPAASWRGWACPMPCRAHSRRPSSALRCLRPMPDCICSGVLQTNGYQNWATHTAHCAALCSRDEGQWWLGAIGKSWLHSRDSCQ